MFPQVKESQRLDVRFKNVARDVYLCVKEDDNGKHILSTKTLNETVDPDVDFSLYYYTSAEAAETKLVLPVHQSTHVCLSLTADKMLKESSLRDLSELNMNEMPGMLEDPLLFTMADNRFFYIKSQGSNYALEAMNGIHSNNFLRINSSNKPDIQEHNNTSYPEEILFDIEKSDGSNPFILPLDNNV